MFERRARERIRAWLAGLGRPGILQLNDYVHDWTACARLDAGMSPADEVAIVSMQRGLLHMATHMAGEALAGSQALPHENEELVAEARCTVAACDGLRRLIDQQVCNKALLACCLLMASADAVRFYPGAQIISETWSGQPDGGFTFGKVMHDVISMVIFVHTSPPTT